MTPRKIIDTTTKENIYTELEKVESDEEGIAPVSDSEIEDDQADYIHENEKDDLCFDNLDMHYDSTTLPQPEVVDGIKWEFGCDKKNLIMQDNTLILSYFQNLRMDSLHHQLIHSYVSYQLVYGYI